MNRLDQQGWDCTRSELTPHVINELKSTIYREGAAGSRCLLDVAIVNQTAALLRARLIRQSILSERSVAIQAIAFDKTPSTNWKVTWHQDLMFPLAHRATSPGYTLPTVKDGIDYARPPRAVLETLLAVRLHLDDCDETNGPLRVAPGSHRLGILRNSDIASTVEHLGEISCLAESGDAVLMRPLTLHASSVARAPRHRRVLHLVYHSGPETPEPWYRAI
ncbi:MAG: phytanoyl-CoA dioxygenase family protein [Verrucomicrobia bacterium]|nr:phytanoyl-CoA dioxygenase family protein [Verrucomicrobiota bacterium]